MEKCCTSEGCCSSPNSVAKNLRTVTIDFLYLDLTQCDWCQGTENRNIIATLMLGMGTMLVLRLLG